MINIVIEYIYRIKNLTLTILFSTTFAKLKRASKSIDRSVDSVGLLMPLKISEKNTYGHSFLALKWISNIIIKKSIMVFYVSVMYFGI